MAATPENLTEKLDQLYTTTWQIMRPKAADNIFKRHAAVVLAQ